MHFNYTTLFADSFHRADENPVNPLWWTANNNEQPCQILSDELVCNVAADKESTARNIVITWPANQWCELQIDVLHGGASYPNSGVVLVGRAFNSTGYAFAIGGPLGQNPPTDSYFQLYSLINGSLGTLFDSESYTFNVGDKIRVECFEDQISFLVNDTKLGTYADSSIASGAPDIALYYDVGVTDTQVSNFRGGSITQSSGIFVDQWGSQGERIFLDTTGKTQNLSAPFPSSNNSSQRWMIQQPKF